MVMMDKCKPAAGTLDNCACMSSASSPHCALLEAVAVHAGVGCGDRRACMYLMTCLRDRLLQQLQQRCITLFDS